MSKLSNLELEFLIRMVDAQVSISGEYVGSIDLYRVKCNLEELKESTTTGIWNQGSGDFSFSIMHPGNKVSLIKVIRIVTGLGLKEAKDIADESLVKSGVHQLLVKHSTTGFFDKISGVISEHAAGSNIRLMASVKTLEV